MLEYTPAVPALAPAVPALDYTPAISANFLLEERWDHFRSIVGRWGCLGCREEHPCDCTCEPPFHLRTFWAYDDLYALWEGTHHEREPPEGPCF